MEKVKEIVVLDNNDSNEIQQKIDPFNRSLEAYLLVNNLPYDDILNPISERAHFVNSFPHVLNKIAPEKKEKAYYLSKAVSAVVCGLFDASLNYVWNETIRSLRKLIVSYDLQYFYSIAENKNGTRYKNLTTEDELEIIQEFDLLSICAEMGLLSNVAYKQLENINYMRNHASAAHPNDNELTALKMLSFIEDCINYAINVEIEESVMQIKELSQNIRRQQIATNDFNMIIDSLLQQPQTRLDNFVYSLHGLYCDDGQQGFVYTNIEGLIVGVWNACSENKKHEIGAKFGKYTKNGDQTRKNSTQRFLEIVDGLSYKDEDSLNSEILEMLNELRSAHFGYDNFYTEGIYAQNISKMLQNKPISNAIRKQFVKTICQCYIGNGNGYYNGVSDSALPHYRDFIGKFTLEEIKEFVKLFDDIEFKTDFHKPIATKRVKKLCKFLLTKSGHIHVNNLLEHVINSDDSVVFKVNQETIFKKSIQNIK
jgi:hypothetical protein